MASQDVTLWGMHAGRTGDADHIFLKRGYIAIGWVKMGDLSLLPPDREAFNEIAERQGQELLEAHRRVRTAARLKGMRYSVQPQLPPDILGVYSLVPVVT